MTTLSSAAWVAHDIGLATAIGGTLYGQTAMHPALEEVSDADERDRAADTAWRRFSWVNLAAHGVFAASWFAGRSLLSGGEAGPTARRLTVIKDGLVVASLATGIASMILGRLLGKKIREHQGPSRALAGEADRSAARLQRAVDVTSTVNLAANVGVLGVTALLAMESSESARFPLTARKLP